MFLSGSAILHLWHATLHVKADSRLSSLWLFQVMLSVSSFKLQIFHCSSPLICISISLEVEAEAEAEAEGVRA